MNIKAMKQKEKESGGLDQSAEQRMDQLEIQHGLIIRSLHSTILPTNPMFHVLDRCIFCSQHF